MATSDWSPRPAVGEAGAAIVEIIDQFEHHAGTDQPSLSCRVLDAPILAYREAPLLNLRHRFLCFNVPSNSQVASLFVFIGCLTSHGQAAPQDSSTRIETKVDDKENKAILEVGAATSWNVSGGAVAFAPNLAAEIEPIENWIELEMGVSPFYTHNSKEWDTDLLFKKPWTLSRKAEFMAGVGPQWVHLKQSGRWTNTVAGEVAGDFMFWPNGKHHFGWYLEPAYDYSFARGHQKSLGISFGLLIGVR